MFSCLSGLTHNRLKAHLCTEYAIICSDWMLFTCTFTKCTHGLSLKIKFVSSRVEETFLSSFTLSQPADKTPLPTHGDLAPESEENGRDRGAAKPTTVYSLYVSIRNIFLSNFLVIMKVFQLFLNSTAGTTGPVFLTGTLSFKVPFLILSLT